MGGHCSEEGKGADVAVCRVGTCCGRMGGFSFFVSLKKYFKKNKNIVGVVRGVVGVVVVEFLCGAGLFGVGGGSLFA